jgi:hypothetical protein
MPFLNLRGNSLLAAVTVAAGMGFILFGKFPSVNVPNYS